MNVMLILIVIVSDTDGDSQVILIDY